MNEDEMKIVTLLPNQMEERNPFDEHLENIFNNATASETRSLMEMVFEFIDAFNITNPDDEEQQKLATVYRQSISEGLETPGDVIFLMIAKNQTTIEAVAVFMEMLEAVSIASKNLH